MCEMATLGLVGTLASTALSAAGQFVQMQQTEKAQKTSAEYNAQIAANEAATQQQLAQNEIAKGIADRERQQRQAARQMGEMRAAIGASGLVMDSGTTLSLLEESAVEHQYDSNIITHNAANAAWQRGMAVTSALNDQAMFEYQRANAGAHVPGAMLGIGSSLMGGMGASMEKFSRLGGTLPSITGSTGTETNNTGAQPNRYGKPAKLQAFASSQHY